MNRGAKDPPGERGIEELPGNEDAAAKPSADHAFAGERSSASRYWSFMRAAPPALFAVVDEYGNLVPVCTAADLLRACKNRWRAARS